MADYKQLYFDCQRLFAINFGRIGAHFSLVGMTVTSWIGLHVDPAAIIVDCMALLVKTVIYFTMTGHAL